MSGSSRRRNKRAALAAQATARRDDARAETRLKLGPCANEYDGGAPKFIDGLSVFEPRQVGWNTVERLGRVVKSGDARKFSRDRNGNAAKSLLRPEVPRGANVSRQIGETVVDAARCAVPVKP